MKIDLVKFINKNETIGVAVSGGSDSMALLHFMHSNAKKFGIKVKAINIEHGIRGDVSKSDSKFVKIYCQDNGIELLNYSFDSIKEAKDNKLSLEQAARKLRYDCFYDAINTGKVDKVATAHHERDNAETVLFNIFRGTGIKGIAGIEENYENKIIRPFLSITKEEINTYIIANSIPFVTDETNFCDDYTRNYIRLKVLPLVRSLFPEAETAIYRLSETAKMEDEFLNKLATEQLNEEEGVFKISLDAEKALFYRACVLAFKKLGIDKDYEKVHVDAVYALKDKKNSAKVSLPKSVVAIREYDKVVIFKQKKTIKAKKN